MIKNTDVEAFNRRLGALLSKEIHDFKFKTGKTIDSIKVTILPNSIEYPIGEASVVCSYSGPPDVEYKIIGECIQEQSGFTFTQAMDAIAELVTPKFKDSYPCVTTETQWDIRVEGKQVGAYFRGRIEAGNWYTLAKAIPVY